MPQSIEIMMAVWSPGFYRVEGYADQVENLEARTTDGTRAHGRNDPQEPLAYPDGGRAQGCHLVSARL